jgi:hypothetical protein
MSRTMFSACVNHPAVEATTRCKACLKPICNACRVMGPTGVFCSTECKEKYEQFVERAARLEQMRKPKTFNLARIRSIVIKVIILAAVVLVAGFVASLFDVEIPVLSGIVERLRETAGL